MHLYLKTDSLLYSVDRQLLQDGCNKSAEILFIKATATFAVGVSIYFRYPGIFYKSIVKFSEPLAILPYYFISKLLFILLNNLVGFLTGASTT